MPTKSPAVRVVRVDVTALMSASSKRVQHASQMGQDLRIPSRDKTLVGGLFLSGRPQAKHYVFFHVDRDADKKQLFVHLVWAPKPNSEPPADAKERCESGITAEKALEALFQLVICDEEAGDATASIDAELRVSGWRHPIGTYAPLVHGSSVLEHVGAEFSVSEPGLGLKRLRWLEARGATKVWVSLTEQTDFRYNDFAKTVKEKCRGILRAMNG